MKIVKDNTNLDKATEVIDRKFKKHITNLLINGVMDVTFTKKDGTERTMNCTLSPILVPSVKQDELVEDHKKGIKRHNPDVRTVWDLEKKGWRSFRYDSINKYETVCDIQEEIDRNQQEINDFKQEQRDLRKDRKIEKFVLNTEEKKK